MNIYMYAQAPTANDRDKVQYVYFQHVRSSSASFWWVKRNLVQTHNNNNDERI